MKRSKGSPDWILLAAVAVLTAIGVLMVFSASQYFAQYAPYNDVHHFLKKQALHALIGFGGMLCAYFFNYRNFHYLAYPALVVVFILLIMVLVAGSEDGGAVRWLVIAGFNFQPSELCKLASILAAAKYISDNHRRIDSFKSGFLPMMILMGACCGMVFMQNDLSTAMVIAGSIFVMMFCGGVKIWYMLATFVGGVVLGTLAIVTSEFRMERIMAYLDPWTDPQGYGFQAIQSLYAIGNGGLTGVGLGGGGSKWFYLPERHTDFIFSVLCEEMGFLGGLLVIALFVIFVWRGLMIAVKAPDLFSSMVALGITAMIGLQAFLNLGVTTGLLPVTGITLPFISYGGTSLVMSLAAVGVLLNISCYTERRR